MTTSPFADITGIVLAGGRGSRMGGVDKGLQIFHETPLALHTLHRLQQQVGPTLINANRNLATYASFGVPVWPDALVDYAGPLAGFLTGFAQCKTPYLMTVPCDTPLFPPDLVSRLIAALTREHANIAMAAAREEDGQLRTQPVFCLLKAELQASLIAFTQGGGRKIDAWTTQNRTVVVPFDLAGDDPHAFFNANTLAELHSLERL
ncbi:MAG: putative molybdopterin-guanine dinucleotide biosynthesis protein [Pseudomonadota bacterium]|jgi:molybdopterin-guanine dinucleotide biosynthesis protein A